MARQTAGQARAKRLWKDFFRDPSQWLDCRCSKSHPQAPDFRHKTTNEPLWLHGRSFPSWVPDILNFEPIEQFNAPLQDMGLAQLCLNDALLRLQQECHGPPPPVKDLACILHMCKKEGSQEHALRLRDCIERHGLTSAVSLGNALVSTLVEVGCIHQAHSVFGGLLHRDGRGWNSLILGYCKSEHPHEALQLYRQMRDADTHLSLSGHTIVALLKVCAVVKDLMISCELHIEIVNQGLLENDAYVGSALIDTYAKCGSLAKAQEVFDKLLVRDAVSWTSLIAGYVEHGSENEALYLFEQMQQQGTAPDGATYVCVLRACGMVGNTVYGQHVAQKIFNVLASKDLIFWNAFLSGYAEQGFGEKALKCYEDMQQEGICPNHVTYLCLLKACGSIGDMNKGQEVHGSVALIGLDRDPTIGSSLVDMYVRCGSLKGARAVFDKVPDRGVIAWNALMAGYAERCGEEVLDCFENMQLNHICPDYVTFVCCLKACGSMRDSANGLAIHRRLLREGLETDIIVASMLIRMYGKLGLLSKAREVFEKLPFRDAVSYNALITGYVENEHYEEALTCFDQLLHQGIHPHQTLLACVLKACTSLRYVPRGQEIHTDIARQGLEEDILLACTLLDFYGKCGLLAAAQKVFDQVPVRDVALWNALISVYASFGCTDMALKYFGQMQHKGVCPDNVSYTCLLKACSKSELIAQNQELHADIIRKGFETELFVGSALVNVYARSGSLTEAQYSFSKLSVQDDVSWTTIIMGYALQLGNAHKTMKLFEKMVGEGIEPNVVTFISLLNAYSHSGLVEKGRMYFESISCPAHDHYACVLDLLCRAGFMEESLMVIENIPFHPGNLVWETMLGACQKWGRIELGRKAFDHVVLADESNAAAYVCMANIYANAAILDFTIVPRLEAGV